MHSSVKKIGLFRLTSLVTGNLVGSGVFLLPATLAAFGSISILGWVVTSIGAMMLALVFASLSSVLPKAGGPYAYTKKAFGSKASFFVCWAYWTVAWISNAALVAGAVGYMSTFFTFDKSTALFMELAVLITITGFNLFSIKMTGTGELIVTILKIIPLVVLPLIGVFYIDFANLEYFNTSGKTFSVALNSVAFLTIWGFIGLETGTVPGNEVEHPSKNIPLATILGTLIAAIVYILGTVVIMGVIPHAELLQSTAPYADATTIILGGSWGNFFAATAIFSCIGTLNGWTMIVGRMPQAAADEGLFPKAFSVVNRHNTPYVGILISSCLTIPFIVMSTSDSLLDQFNYIIEISTTLILLIYLVCIAAYFKLLSADKKLTVGKIIIGALALTFNLWALWAANLTLVMQSLSIVICGIPMFLYLRKSLK